MKVMVGYKVDEAVIFGVGCSLKSFDIGYSYDLSNTKLASHELGIRVRIGKNKEGNFDHAFYLIKVIISFRLILVVEYVINIWTILGLGAKAII